MKEISRKNIDWEKTGIRLRDLRDHDLNLRRYVCWYFKFGVANCSGDCMNCIYEMDKNVSRTELSMVFAVTESVLFNWETGKTPPELEDLLLYADICGLTLDEIIVFAN